MKDMDVCQLFKVRLLWEKIDKILHLRDSKVKGLDYIPIINTLCLGKDNKLHLNFNCKYGKELYIDLFRVLPDMELHNNGEIFVIPHGYAVYEDDVEVLSNKEQEFNIKINRIDYGNMDEKSSCYWRYVYPIKYSRWFQQIETLNYMDDDGTHVGLAYQKAVLGNSTMHVFLTERHDDCYLVIQSECKIDSEEMYKRAFAITTTLGLITGNIFGGYHIQVASDDKDFDSMRSMIFGTIEENKYSIYRIVNNKWVDAYDMLGRFEYQQYAQEILKEDCYDTNSYYDNKPLKAVVFEKLVNLCYNNNDIAISVSMLLEGSTLNMLYQPSFFLIALETITSALGDCTKNIKNLPWDKDEYNKKVKPILIKSLDKIDDLPYDAKRIYSSRLDNLNSPANQDKLAKSFEKYGYILTDEDKNAIKRRNYTFHGHLSDIKKELGEQRWDMLAVALRLHKLCCILLLKAAGYSGRIWNNEVIMGVEEACKRKDPPYLNI